jgi:hypothetical protein
MANTCSYPDPEVVFPQYQYWKTVMFPSPLSAPGIYIGCGVDWQVLYSAQRVFPSVDSQHLSLEPIKQWLLCDNVLEFVVGFFQYS